MEFHFRFARSAVVAKTACAKPSTVSNTRARFGLKTFSPTCCCVKPSGIEKRDWDFIVPVPLHPLKKREREFNQAEILARHLADETQIQLNNKILRRIMPTATQTLLSRDKRATNMKGAFAVR